MSVREMYMVVEVLGEKNFLSESDQKPLQIAYFYRNGCADQRKWLEFHKKLEKSGIAYCVWR